MNKHVSKLLQPGVFWYCLILLAFAVAAALLDQYYLAAGELVVTVIAMVVSRLLFIRRRNALMQYVQSATDAEGISVHAGSPFPMAVIRLPEGEIIWGNEGFYAITGLSDGCRYQTLESVVPGFTTGWLREGRNELPGDQLIGTRRYRIYGNYVRSEDDATTVRLATIFFADMTEMFNVRDEFLRTRPITAVILIDNYDELMSNLPDSTISKLDAQINEAVSGWVTGLHALCRKIERNRYLLLFESKDLSRLQEGKFSILDAIRAVTNPAGVNATISLGIGKDGSSFEENYSFANLSIEMALSRGGDQAVIKDRYNFTFYGGRTKETERRTRVKSRVVAGSLSELISQSSKVFVMGHKMADLDALGAAVGISCLCRKRGKTAQIVIDLEEDVFKNTLDVNLLGAYRCAKHVSRYMIDHKIKGKMLLVSSNSAYLPQPVFGGYAHYTASKGGVIAMTTELAKELKRYGIMVNTVAPGGMFTPGCMVNGPVRTLPPEKQAELGKEMMVAKLDEIPTADSVAIVVYGMCTRMADGVTGECIVADSGMMRNIMAFQPAIEQYPPAEG